MNWDSYFMSICDTISSKSPCLSRKIGAILVRDHSIISTGYNGPPRGAVHCGVDRLLADEHLCKTLVVDARLSEIDNTCCPRKLLNYRSGEALTLCPAQHAEENCISNAARIGASTIGSTLYLNTCIPCKNCLGTLINAGVVEIVAKSLASYDNYSGGLFNGLISIRRYTEC